MFEHLDAVYVRRPRHCTQIQQSNEVLNEKTNQLIRCNGGTSWSKEISEVCLHLGDSGGVAYAANFRLKCAS